MNAKDTIPKRSKHPYISCSSKISGCSPIVSGTRLRVIDLVIEYDRFGLTPDQIIDAHPHLTLDALHDALPYYYENRVAIDNELKQRKENIRKFLNKFPSKIKKPLAKFVYYTNESAI